MIPSEINTLLEKFNIAMTMTKTIRIKLEDFIIKKGLHEYGVWECWVR